MATGSKRTAARPCVKCGTALRAKDRFCSTCGAPVASDVATVPIAPEIAPPRGTPSASLQVGEQKPHALEEQRKLISVVFIDLAGSTPIAERLDPEDLRNALSIYFNVTSRRIAQYGGTIDKYIGDAVMAVFGAPVAHEDDAARAINAALAIQADMRRENDDIERRYGARLTLRTGINTGEVVAGMLGGDAQSAYTVTGDTVSTAQRLEGAAPHGEILVSEATRALAHNAFIFEAIPPLTLKGKSQPVPAYRVIGAERRSAPRGGSTLVGRAAELARLFELYRRATSGQGEVVHLHGEAGVGKSRVLAEFLEAIPGSSNRVRARCSSYETATPYALVADLLRRVVRITATDDLATARGALEFALASLALPLEEEGAMSLVLEVLGYDERSVLDPERKRGLLGVVLRQLLVQRATSQAVVVACEDLHWIDQASASLLSELTREVSTQRLLFLTTGRGADDAPWEAVRISLDPFDAERAAELIDRVATAPLDDRARGLILERAGGNAFFIEELVRSLASGRTTVPATVQEVLQARFDGLDGTPRRVAQRASVIGRSFWLRVLARIIPGDPLETSLVTLERERFIEARERAPDPTYAFHHALVQEVIYGSQLTSQRRLAHGAVGLAIEELYEDRVEEFTDTLAFHYDRSDSDEKALLWLVRAGDRAKSLFANEDAITLFTAALRRSKDGNGPHDASAILERIGDVRSLTGKYDAAIESFNAALERGATLSGDSVARGHRKIGMAHVLKGAFAQALDAYAAGLGAAGASKTLETARITAQIGQLQWRRGDYDAARDALSKAVEDATALGADDVLADGLKQLGNISLFAGDPHDAEQQYRRSRAISERREDLPAIAGVRLNLGDAYCRLGQWDAALDEFAAALALYQRIGDPWCIALIHNNVGEVERIKGNIDEAVPAFERSVAISRSTGDAAGLALALTGLGAARAEAGEPARGRDELLEAERLFATVGSTTYLPDLYRFLASAELALAELEPAAQAAARSLEFARAAKVRHQEAMTLRVAGEIALARGDRGSARKLLEESKETLLALGEKAELAHTEAALARLGD